MRFDLAENKYTAEDPRQVLAVEALANGYTPSSTQMGQMINSPQSPWIAGIRAYVYDGNKNALAEMQETVQAAVDAAR